MCRCNVYGPDNITKAAFGNDPRGNQNKFGGCCSGRRGNLLFCGVWHTFWGLCVIIGLFGSFGELAIPDIMATMGGAVSGEAGEAAATGDTSDAIKWIKAATVWDLAMGSKESGEDLKNLEIGACGWTEETTTEMFEEAAEAGNGDNLEVPMCGCANDAGSEILCPNRTECLALKDGPDADQRTCVWVLVKEAVEEMEEAGADTGDFSDGLDEFEDASNIVGQVIYILAMCLAIGCLLGGALAIFNGAVNGILLPVLKKNMACLQCVGCILGWVQLLCNFLGLIASLIFVVFILMSSMLMTAAEDPGSFSGDGAQEMAEDLVQDAIEGKIATGLMLTFIGNFMLIFFSCFCCSLCNGKEITDYETEQKERELKAGGAVAMQQQADYDMAVGAHGGV